MIRPPKGKKDTGRENADISTENAENSREDVDMSKEVEIAELQERMRQQDCIIRQLQEQQRLAPPDGRSRYTPGS
ncbi:hypothetical protein KM043_000150 [Ampulex compressa]|nr:hypothetical protein KM043_000150 [Ampulex compressa]